MNMDAHNNIDVAIIGAGPVGLFGVFACGMLGLRAAVIDALPDIGGQCTALYPDKPIYDIPGFPQVAAADLIAALEAQAAPFTPAYHLNQPVTGIEERAGVGFTLSLGNKNILETKTVLIAGGAGAFGPNRPPLADLEHYENKSVFYAIRTPARFAGKTVVIAGGGDSGVDWANILANGIAAKIYLVHRRDQFRAAPASMAILESHIAAGRVEKITPYQLSALTGDAASGTLTAVTVTDLDGHARTLPCDALLCFFGLSTALGILERISLAQEGHGIIIDPTTAATSRTGIFAAGDIATYPHKLKLILTGFAEITAAAHSIYRHIHPDKPLHMVHSTTRGIPKT